MKLEVDVKESKIETMIRSIYNEWHLCSLKTGKEVKGGKKGQMCDDCEEMIKARMKDLLDGN